MSLLTRRDQPRLVKTVMIPSEMLVKSQQKVSDKIKNGLTSYNCVFPGLFLANGETIKDVALLKQLRVTHVLNAAEDHVRF